MIRKLNLVTRVSKTRSKRAVRLTLHNAVVVPLELIQFILSLRITSKLYRKNLSKKKFDYFFFLKNFIFGIFETKKCVLRVVPAAHVIPAVAPLSARPSATMPPS